MIGTALVVLWLVALTFIPQTTQSCTGDCQEGYRSVCVQRGSICKCSCVKDVASGSRALRELLSAYNVSAQTIDAAEERYKEMASHTTGDFSFTVQDIEGLDLTIRGQGIAGTSNVIVDVESEIVAKGPSVTPNKTQLRPRVKSKTFKKKPTRKKTN
ncbi:MAG TPA: hypothetical protein VJP89_03765 [Pyrinomonadaceae bacterium]|nr:hypothetical protein [Pyrinomonadaceae bacterium]